MAKTVYGRCVEKAAEILGGQEAVARHLGATPAMVTSWIEGETEPPTHYLLRLVDLIESRTVTAARTATVVRSRRDEGR